jgi:hypothetical protein
MHLFGPTAKRKHSVTVPVRKTKCFVTGPVNKTKNLQNHEYYLFGINISFQTEPAVLTTIAA